MRITEPYTIHKRHLSSGKVVYYYQTRDEHGRRSIAKSTGCDTLSKAKKFCQKLFNLGEMFPSSAWTFGKFVENFFAEDSEYVLWRKANGNEVKPETIKAYEKALNNQILPYFRDMKINSITSNTAKKWVIWCNGQWAAKTINNAQGVLNIIFESAIDKNYINQNPLRNINLRKVHKKNRELLTIQELNLIYHANWASETHRKMFLLACITGMRIGEIAALRQDDIEHGYVQVRHTWSRQYGLGTTKTRTERFVPVPESFTYPDNVSDWVFKGKDNKPLQTHTIYNGLTRICQQIGIDCKSRGITVHTLRNFFISYLQGKAVPLEKIKAVVGHADTNMTEHYTYWTPEMLKEVVQAQEELIVAITRSDYGQIQNRESNKLL